jgi:GPH family glycoside/pentoside/hexuronide:cation symporter
MNRLVGQPVAVENKRETLTVAKKLAVGTGGLAVSLGNQSVRVTGQGVLNMVLHINALWVGIVLAVPLFWDAMIDPIVGHISDNFRSRFGRRRPFIVAGAFLMGLSFAAIWMVPLGWTDGGKLIWFTVTSLLFYTAYSIFSVPYFGLTYELTADYDERTSVQGFVTLWNRLGEMSYMGLIPFSLTFIAWKYGYSDTTHLTTPERMEGIRTVAAIYGFLGMTFFGMLPAFVGKERLYDTNVRKQRDNQDSFWRSAKLALQNKACVYLVILTISAILAGVIAANMDWYLLIYYLSDGDIALGTQWKLIVTIGYAIMGIAGIPLVVWLTGKMSKVRGLQFVYCMEIINSVIRWIVYQPGRFHEALHWGSLAQATESLSVVAKSFIWLDPLTGGIFWIGIGILGQSMTADICDEDELKNGHRREGMFGAVYSWATKASIALGFVAVGFVLNVIGFDPSLTAQTPNTYLGMRIAMCFGAAVPSLFCLLLLRSYPLTRAKSNENRRQLEARRGDA